MELANYINYAMNSILKNLILKVLTEINILKILKQDNFIKRDVGYPLFQIILHSDSAFGKDTYYRFIKESRYNWRRFLLLSSIALL